MTMENLNTTDEYVLQMQGITKVFPGVKALDGVHLNVRPGSVHALMGENGAGKSTLMKCLFGIYRADEGQILFKGRQVNYTNAKDALVDGVSMVHQELNQVRQRSIADNIWLGRYPKKGLFIDEEKMYNETLAIFKELDINLDPSIKLNKLSVSEMQMVEIAKAVSFDSRILVLDEPTSSLTEKEVDHLFRIIRALRDRGVGIIYISHKMEEISKISDDVTIMRDGKWIATKRTAEITTDEIINLMVGRDLTNRFPPKGNSPGNVILEVAGLTGMIQPSFKDVSFDLREGEILGIAGLVGSKRTEVVEAIFGIRQITGGTLCLHGRHIQNTHPNKAIEHGFALVTEERRANGIFAMLPVSFNTIISNMKRYTSRFGILSDKLIERDTRWAIDSMRVKTPSSKTLIRNLSGGNQQKVIIGRWMLTEPEIFMMDEPTRGIDVGAKYEIYQLMIDLANKGKGIIMISSEMPELLGVTDRILVMSNGQVAGILDTAEATQEEIMRLSAKYL